MKTLAAIAALFSLCSTAHGSNRLDFLVPEETSRDPHARTLFVEQVVTEFSERVGEYCRRQNEELRAAGKFACSDSHCVEWVEDYEPGQSLNLTFRVESAPGDLRVSFEIGLETPPRGTLGLCYHPRLMPATVELSRTLHAMTLRP